jgi:uncharacterized small protein (DUF1192 family)
MAKALFGHVGSGNDLRVAAEVARMRQRIEDLEAEVHRLQADNARLASADARELLELSLADPEPLAAGQPALT